MESNLITNPIDGLPLHPKEKVARWLLNGTIFGVGIAAIIGFMPFVIKATTLLINGVLSFLELGLVFAGTCAATFAIMKAIPLYKTMVESWANKLTWALNEYDPITPMEMWLAEMHRDAESVKSEYLNIDGVVANTEQMVNDNLTGAARGDKKFDVAVRQFGPDSQEAKMASIGPGRLRQTAENIKERLEPLQTLRQILREVVNVTEYTEAAAKADVEGMKQEFGVERITKSATDSAERVLLGRSQRKQAALRSMGIIHSKYAEQFGRLRGLRELSSKLLLDVDLEKGGFHQDALDRLAQIKAQSALITGGIVQPKLLEAVKAGDAPGVSFYRVPEPVRIRK